MQITSRKRSPIAPFVAFAATAAVTACTSPSFTQVSPTPAPSPSQPSSAPTPTAPAPTVGAGQSVEGKLLFEFTEADGDAHDVFGVPGSSAPQGGRSNTPVAIAIGVEGDSTSPWFFQVYVSNQPGESAIADVAITIGGKPYEVSWTNIAQINDEESYALRVPCEELQNDLPRSTQLPVTVIVTREDASSLSAIDYIDTRGIDTANRSCVPKQGIAD